MRMIVLVVTCAAMLCMATGCNLFDAHVKEFDLMRGMAADVTGRMNEGALGQYQVSGQGLNPGITVEAAVVYRATAKYEGLAGQFGASAQGSLGNRMSAEEFLNIVNTSSNKQDIIDKIFAWLMAHEKASTTQPSTE